jgi:prepilin-type N-terminal cleavage/methylation domain-containing protein
MTVKFKKTGFTIVEVMTAVAIIAMLVAILIPALAMVRKIAKETQQKAQFTTIDLAITAFKSDYGDYPESGPERDDWGVYTGAQKLAEAMMGQDLMGFHEDSSFRSNLKDESGEPLYPDDLDPTTDEGRENLDARQGPYLELATANAFWLGEKGEREGLFEDTLWLGEDTYVLCDVFGIKKITFANGETAKAGTPILYYRANISSKTMIAGRPQEQIYNVRDNMPLIALGKLPEPDRDRDPHELADEGVFYSEDYGILDPKVTATKTKARWPHRPDSYILISAGADGEYGTSDDIFNF